MRINGSPIDDYRFQPGPATITYTMIYEKTEARIAAGLSIDEWDALPGTPEWVDPDKPVWSKCEVLIWWRMRNRIPAVSQDLQNRELQSKRRTR